ncbi:hypothetical protein [Neobacillus sp. 114]|uniref:hypothetical protein n=1 Tax=Neobacillus sp. 114 TaxID=3048535 RepID=UPI0024C30A3A|nr:hypothetical protein [Neobacillus sp. 114]
MTKFDPNKQFSFEFDENGAIEVSEQIMNSYNSGFIGEGTAIATNGDFSAVEE